MAAVAVLACVASVPAHAEDPPLVCVECTMPDAVYACTLPVEVDGRVVKKGAQLMRYACISEIARIRGHAECRVQRSFQGPCIGEPFVLGARTPDPPPRSDAPPAAAPPASTRSSADDPAAARPTTTPALTEAPAKADAARARPDGRASDEPPKTLKEMAERTAEASKSQLEKAGDGISTTLKQSWRCLTSLFNDC